MARSILMWLFSLLLWPSILQLSAVALALPGEALTANAGQLPLQTALIVQSPCTL